MPQHENFFACFYAFLGLRPSQPPPPNLESYSRQVVVNLMDNKMMVKSSLALTRDSKIARIYRISVLCRNVEREKYKSTDKLIIQR